MCARLHARRGRVARERIEDRIVKPLRHTWSGKVCGFASSYMRCQKGAYNDKNVRDNKGSTAPVVPPEKA
jgi:hypothetical protein